MHQGVREIVRNLNGNLFSLHLYLDILSLMDLPSFPHETSVQSLIKWSEESAEHEIERLQRHIKFDQTKQQNNEKEWKRDLFLDPKKRGQWIDLHFKSHEKDPQILRSTEKWMKRRRTLRKLRKFT